MKIEFSSHRREMFLFLTNNMAAVTSRQTNNIDITIYFPEKLIGHFRVPSGLCIKTRLSAQPLIWK